jgi:hypothetical protein
MSFLFLKETIPMSVYLTRLIKNKERIFIIKFNYPFYILNLLLLFDLMMKLISLQSVAAVVNTFSEKRSLKIRT